MTDTPAHPAQRLTLSRVLELVLTRSAGDVGYVSLGRTAKGDTTIDVKVVVDVSPAGAATTAEAADRARALFDSLRDLYPTDTDDAPASVSLTRNAKGETQIEVQAKTGDTHRAPDLAAIAELATSTYKTLRARFPLASGMVGAEGGTS